VIVDRQFRESIGRSTISKSNRKITQSEITKQSLNQSFGRSTMARDRTVSLRDAPTPSPRLDVWLDVACLFKTRSEAQRACRLGKVMVNGVAAKPHREIRIGDQLTLQRPLGRRQTVVVRGIAHAHVSKADARLLYADTTPPPTEEEVAMRRLERLYRATTETRETPERRQQRTLRRLKRGEI
jgi:ribosome-associated heat shock protein Hsp15